MLLLLLHFIEIASISRREIIRTDNRQGKVGQSFQQIRTLPRHGAEASMPRLLSQLTARRLQPEGQVGRLVSLYPLRPFLAS